MLERAAAAPWQRYPEFVPTGLVERLAAHYGWIPDGVVAGNGSNELIQATLAVVLASGDAVVAPSPTFSLYRLLTGVLGGRYVPVPLGQQFEFDVDRIVETAVRERARVVVLNSPNNPTGSALAEGAVERILAETGALVVCDEAYQDFGGPTAIPLLRRTSRVVVLRTFSKAMGMAGLRFGLALAHPAVAGELAKGKLPYNVNLITLAAAEVALDHAAAARRADPGDRRDPRPIPSSPRRDPGDRRFPHRGQLRADPLPGASRGGGVPPAARGARHPGARRLRLRRAGGVPADLDRHGGGHGRGARRVVADPRPGGAVSERVAEIRRTTKETDLFVRVGLDGRGEARVKTGIGFFDHMLEALARHGLLDLTVEAQGDLHVDGHHTVEDTGIALGTAIARALGDRAGIRRYGDALVPLDDALVRAVVDVSGRPYIHYDIEIPKWQMLGDYDVFLTPEFFRALVLNAGLTAHLDLVRGDNPHHIVEATFKAFARALDAATSLDPRVAGVPSTKGAL